METIQRVDVVEPQAARGKLALQLGAATALAPDQANQLAHPYPVALECSGRNVAFELIQAKLKPGGRICILSDGNLEPLVLAPDFHEKELTIIGSSDGWDYHKHAAWFFNLLRQGSPALEAIFDYEITQDKLVDTFESMAAGLISPVKVFVRYR